MPSLNPSGPKLNRADSLPTRLPSRPSEPTEVKPGRKPITLPMPDTRPPKTFEKPRKRFELPSSSKREERRTEAAVQKERAMPHSAGSFKLFNERIHGDPEFMDIIASRHPGFGSYDRQQKIRVFNELANHPRFRAEWAKLRNEINEVPNGPTSSRKMRPDEHVFRANAFQRMAEETKGKPFHIHGEMGVVGNKRGEITHFNYTAGAEVESRIQKGSRYHLHSHPPFMEPFTSSASEQDHMIAAHLYSLHGNKMDTYVTNGKEVLQIMPNSMELIKLVPDPKVEVKLGKFPEAFRVPDPQRPPYPFSNHEAPAAYGKSAPPEG